MIRRAGAIFIVSAPSGAGKTTLINRLLKSFAEMEISVSCTTRPPRPGEKHGRDYFFVTERQFAAMRARGEFAEWARVHGAHYGTPRRQLERSLRAGKEILLDIDVQGARKIKRQYPQAVSIFILPPSLRELGKRLVARGTDRGESIRRRLENARREIREVLRYDYFIENRDLREALACLKAIIIAERQKVSRYRAPSGRFFAFGRAGR